MAAYNDQVGDDYYVDDPAGSFEQDPVYALDAGVCHTVNQVLAQAIRPIKHHLIGFAEQQGWVASSGPQIVEEPSLSVSLQAHKLDRNPHTADFGSLIRSLAKEHDYNSSASAPKSKTKRDLDSSSSAHSSNQGDDHLRKRKKKTHHQEKSVSTPKMLTFEPEDIIYPRSTLCLPLVEVADYVEFHIWQGFEKEVRSRLRSECPRPDFPSRVTETLELEKFSKDPKKGLDRAWCGC
ncbi:hypothetical protein NDU88_008567 [Pleurodeles waltl]|uniref:Uncharacterized protein n=1 Tax=Pleurodeles waltl TaxID=8319 RepID=A0AAV7NZC1_PLEWA|nr:hypothetical protein NDU88_008567 [Pleurodeles waltl]